MSQTLDPLRDQPLGQKLISKGFWLYFFTAIILPTGYLTRIMISQSLSVEEVGLLYTIIGFVGVLSSYNDLGLTGALVYYIPKLWIEKSKGKILGLISLASLAQMLTTVAISLFLWFGGEWLATSYFHNADAAILLRRFVWYFVGINIFQIITVIFRSFQDVIREKAVEAVKMRSILLFSVWVFWGSGTPSLVGFGTARVAGMVVALLLGMILFGTRYGRQLRVSPVWYRPLIRDFGKYAVYTFLVMSAGVLFGQIDQQMVNYFLGNEMAGYYTNFLSLTTLATLILSPLGSLMYPLFTEMFAKSDIDGVRRLIELYYHELLLLLLSVSAFLFVLGPEIAALLFGPEWRFSGELLRWYMPFLWIHFMNGVNLTIIGAHGQAKDSAVIIWIGVTANILVNYIAMMIWGVWGAIIGQVISVFLMYMISVRVISNITKRNINFAFWRNNGLLICLCLVCLLGLCFIQSQYSRLVYITGIFIFMFLALGFYNYSSISSSVKSSLR